MTLEYDFMSADDDDDFVGVVLRLNVDDDKYGTVKPLDTKVSGYWYWESHRYNTNGNARYVNGLYRLNSAVLPNFDNMSFGGAQLHSNYISGDSPFNYSDSWVNSNGVTPLNVSPTYGWTKMNQWIHYKYQMKGNTFSVWRDGELVLEQTDLDANAITSGTFALVNMSQSFRYKNFVSSVTRVSTKSVLLTLFSCLCTFIPSLLLYYIDSYYNFNNGLASAFDIVNTLVVIALFISYIFIFGNIITNFEDDIIYQAYHDKLTGLHNRTLLSQLTFDSDHTYVAILDIDDFKKVNDTYGHDVGDLVLRHLSKVLTLESKVNHDLHIMRWGGEEFVLVYNNDRDFLDIVNAIRDDILQSYVDIDSRKIIYRVTIGVANYEDDKDLEELIKVADVRLYLGKKSGKNKIVYKE